MNSNIPSPLKSPTKRGNTAVLSDLNQQIAILRSKKKDAISNLDYSSAKSYDQEIAVLRNDSFQRLLKNLNKEFKDKIVEIVESYNGTNNEISKKYFESEVKYRRKTNSVFEELKKVHISQLIECEKEFSSLRLRETQRSIPQYDELINESKHAALQGNYETARMLQEKAEFCAQSELEIKLAKIDQNYEFQLSQIRSQQKESMQFLVNKFVDGLKEMKERETNRLLLETSNRDSYIYGELAKYKRKLGTLVPVEECTKYENQLEKYLGEILLELNTTIPKNVCYKARTRASPRK